MSEEFSSDWRAYLIYARALFTSSSPVSNFQLLHSCTPAAYRAILVGFSSILLMNITVSRISHSMNPGVSTRFWRTQLGLLHHEQWYMVTKAVITDRNSSRTAGACGHSADSSIWIYQRFSKLPVDIGWSTKIAVNLKFERNIWLGSTKSMFLCKSVTFVSQCFACAFCWFVGFGSALFLCFRSLPKFLQLLTEWHVCSWPHR